MLPYEIMKVTQDTAPIDYAFEVGMIETKLDAPKL